MPLCTYYFLIEEPFKNKRLGALVISKEVPGILLLQLPKTDIIFNILYQDCGIQKYLRNTFHLTNDFKSIILMPSNDTLTMICCLCSPAVLTRA